MDDRTLNNQPKTGGHNGQWCGGEMRTEGSLGDVNSSCGWWWSWEGYKTKIIVELSNYFFSRPVSSQPNYIKHLIVALHQPLPHRLLGLGVGWTDSPMPCHCNSKWHHYGGGVCRWSTALVKHQSLLFLREQTYDTVDNEFSFCQLYNINKKYSDTRIVNLSS